MTPFTCPAARLASLPLGPSPTRVRQAPAHRRVAGARWSSGSATRHAASALTFQCAGIAVDFSKQRADARDAELLVALARERGVPAGHRATLFAGERVNVDRKAALRCTRRCAATSTCVVDGARRLPRDPAQPRAHARVRRGGAQRPVEGRQRASAFTHVLAHRHRRLLARPQARASRRCAAKPTGPRCASASNVDAAEFDDAIAGLDPRHHPRRRRLEDLHDAGDAGRTPLAAREWIAAALGDGADRQACGRCHREPHGRGANFGLPDCNVFPFATGSGGRYSLWSSVGLPIAIATRHGAIRADARRRPRGRPRIPLRPARAQRPGAAGARRHLEPQRAGHRDATRCFATPRASRACPRTCSSSRWNRTASASIVDGRGPSTSTPARSSGAAPRRRASTRSTSGCTRAPTRASCDFIVVRAPMGRHGEPPRDPARRMPARSPKR